MTSVATVTRTTWGGFFVHYNVPGAIQAVTGAFARFQVLSPEKQRHALNDIVHSNAVQYPPLIAA